MKKFLTIALILVLAMTVCVCFAACNKDIDEKDRIKITQIDYSTVLADYLAYPDAANDESMKSITRNVKQIYEDSSLSNAQKAAQMMERATQNEIECEYFSYFRDQVGETKLNGNSGQLIYQRLRRQSDTVKDDITIKLPINATFDMTAKRATTAADIRYISNGMYNRMNNKSSIVYNTETGLLEVAQWKKQSDKNWNSPQEATGSRSYDEARKTCVNWTVENIVDSKDVTIQLKTDGNGKNYYYLKFSIDPTVANKDKTTIDRLENDNGGKGMKYNYCNFEMEIWENGLAKKYFIDESWSGTIAVLYKGSAQSKSTVIFSYSEKDMDYSNTEAIYQGIKK